MPNAAQSQRVAVQTFDWEPLFNLPRIDIAEKHHGVIVECALDGDAPSRQQAVYIREPADFVLGTTACTSVAVNGSVRRNGAGMARAAENVARWTAYLPEECVRSMMNAGWHWST